MGRCLEAGGTARNKLRCRPRQDGHHGGCRGQTNILLSRERQRHHSEVCDRGSGVSVPEAIPSMRRLQVAGARMTPGIQPVRAAQSSGLLAAVPTLEAVPATERSLL